LQSPASESHEVFIKALEPERRTVPQGGDSTPKLLKIAKEIIKEHATTSDKHKKSALVEAAEGWLCRTREPVPEICTGR
jgi:hypothetical protein